ncbi:MAG: hypothetical protein ACFFG0_02555 [Candidatus Thorarchaeota archaeon]
MIKLINNTGQTQHISFINGIGRSVFPNKEITISEKEVYKEELERVKRIFKIKSLSEQEDIEKEEVFDNDEIDMEVE